MIRLIANALILVGLLLIGSYLWAAVIAPWGDPDQSLRFWYLFIFLLGALAVKAGLRLRNRDRGDSPGLGPALNMESGPICARSPLPS
jgi:ABC-type multidrug transport system permease subunit